MKFVEVVPDDSASVIELMREQWESMVGMAAMFVGTIAIGLFIQPAWNFEEAKAFGEEGSSEASNILFELMMIGIFTVVIIWLARKGLGAIIKGFVMFALGLSLFYSVLPFTNLFLYLLNLDSTASVFGGALIITIAAMIFLYLYPEWWVVNSVGVMVGSGVIVMIGISFVPTLVIFFMILAAVYDYWAVHKSKHMLELADTMIGLKLPVLLVSPKEKGYSFLDQEADIMRRIDPQDVQISPNLPDVKLIPKKKSRDALFMGLGDVIFPGMLVISAVTYLPDWGGEIWNIFGVMYLAPLIVGIGTLVGGLFGYMALMTFVAQGNPQPGLPLLNGGAILGYTITGIIVVGPSQLFQSITFLGLL